MPLICEDCPNKSRFQQHGYGSCTYSELILVDESQDECDYGDIEYDNHDQEDTGELICSDCEGTNVERFLDMNKLHEEALEEYGTLE